MNEQREVFVASLDVKTAFDVAKPSVAYQNLTLTGTRTRCGSSVGGDDGREEHPLLREL